MRQAELTQLELLSRVDGLLERCEQWTAEESNWSPARQGRSFLKRLLPRVQKVRERLEMPLVIAMFGGTGTGKSSLVNGLIGQDVTPAGRQRPTTLKPQLLIHPDINLQLLSLPWNECELQRPNVPFLKDIVIVDCPDPDTSEDADASSNLQRLRRFLPHCDVILYTSTQQKYRSANVQKELRDAAAGCKLVFVQTHADQDVDIRDDWRQHLEDEYDVPEMFFVDSLAGLKRLQEGRPAGGDLERLQDFLQQQLSSAHRSRIRRDNVLDLLYASLLRISEQMHEKLPDVQSFQGELAGHTRQLQEHLSERLQEDLLTARQLWERRLAEAVVNRWGSTPFSWLLRAQCSLGALLGSFGLMRARTTAHIALLGLTQGARLWKQRQQENQFDQLLGELDDFSLPAADLDSKRLILEGYARSAGFDSPRGLLVQRSETPSVSDEFRAEFFQDARREVDHAVERLAKRNSGTVTRFLYDALFLIFPIFLLLRIGKNFFWDTMFGGQEILAADFYLPALLFLALWCGLFLMFFIRRLRRGLKQEVRQLVERMLARTFQHDLFPQLQNECRAAERQVAALEELLEECQSLRAEQDSQSFLGSQRPRVTAES